MKLIPRIGRSFAVSIEDFILFESKQPIFFIRVSVKMSLLQNYSLRCFRVNLSMRVEFSTAFSV